MSSTNKTSNYELSQFLGTDKPAWLSDYNQDMSKIDTQMKANADGVTAASGSATSANTAIGTLANLTTDEKTNLVVAINEVDLHANTAQSSADNVGITANSNATKITSLENYLAITLFDDTTATATGASLLANEMKYASNASGTLGKIYGRVVVNTNASSFTVTFGTPFRPTSTINIDGVCMLFDTSSGTQNIIPMQVATDGTVTITVSGLSSGRTIRLLFPACLLFIQNFGD